MLVGTPIKDTHMGRPLGKNEKLARAHKLWRNGSALAVAAAKYRVRPVEVEKYVPRPGRERVNRRKRGREHVNREVAKEAPQTLDELKRALKVAWDRLPQERINDICSGYDRELAQVVAKKGGFA